MRHGLSSHGHGLKLPFGCTPAVFTEVSPSHSHRRAHSFTEGAFAILCQLRVGHWLRHTIAWRRLALLLAGKSRFQDRQRRHLIVLHRALHVFAALHKAGILAAETSSHDPGKDRICLLRYLAEL
jgi:hypothetical protein